MATAKTKVAGAVLTGMVLLGGTAVHEAGFLRNLGIEVAHIAPGDQAKIAAATLNELRKRSGTDAIIYKAACTTVNVYANNSTDAETARNTIYAQLPDYLRPGGADNILVSAVVRKFSTAVAVMSQDNGALSSFYAQNCLGLPR